MHNLQGWASRGCSETEMPFSRSGRSWGCGQDSGAARTHPMRTRFTARSRAVAWLTRAISVNLPNQEERPASHSWAGRGACLTLHQASYLDRATPRKSEEAHPADSAPPPGRQVLRRGSRVPALVLGGLQAQTSCHFRRASYAQGIQRHADSFLL